ncbi:ribonuclease P/MRP protein subunit RPP1, putative [Plasmodium berghei]|uniref:Ribonuclease P/MRP protein subunit RPP1, putative n=3 Tax=Plasmodium berghei TaxID=5821 RepID=A0A509ALZ9_PLABA|nr:ribonuclease P/MRP protein subunit RPP1, putative [Plasmodium berghei ANKA]CXI63862.1 ribonuclease P/MRP protein subunit RPP1, putative [Plasmodium berghei]SCO61143.1 ribonuclease P/MRP protein subunit RPP1, putative [Plasmodium berghei]VUC56626.1 ribonuclease P/MRP protein subunit RPP1, putative [Plasmodium berghei ANKA]|eukprot:XP_034422412.1 ribonuclease P/MRP protein subunit RPP1, putative [Plasmodium berghei ANKA]
MYIDMHIKFSSQKTIKELLFKAISSGYSIVAIAIPYDHICNYNINDKWKVINIFVSKNSSNIIKKLENSNNNECTNYFIDKANYEDALNEYLLKLNNQIDSNYILTNKNNTLSIKNICDDFILNYKHEIEEEEIKKLHNWLAPKFINTENSDNKKDIKIVTHENSYIKTSDNSNNIQTENALFLQTNTDTYILKRLNIKYEDVKQIENYQKFLKESKFDLISIEVTTPEEINIISNKYDCDIIYFDLKKTFTSLKKSDIQNAIDKGLFFEISSPTILTTNTEYFYYSLNLNNIISVIPLNKLIISSGSIKHTEILEPLHFLRLHFNFNKFSYKHLIGCITTVPLSCIQRASVRKSMNTAIFYKTVL